MLRLVVITVPEVERLFPQLPFTLFKGVMLEQFHGFKTVVLVFLLIMWCVLLMVRLHKWYAKRIRLGMWVARIHIL